MSTLRAAFLATIVLALPLAAGPAGAQAEPSVAFTLEVYHFNDGESDLLGETEGDVGAGSIGRFATLLDTLRAAADGAGDAHLTVSAGDNFLAGPELAAGVANGQLYDAIALDLLDVDAFTIGNHEFDFGPQFLADFIGDFDDEVFISANLDFAGEPALQALVDAGRIADSHVVTKGGEQIGIVGATTPELFEVSSPGNTVVDTMIAAAVQAEVDRLTGLGVDKILLSSHLQDITNEIALVPMLTDVDAVIGGGGGEDIAASYPLTAVDGDGVTVPVVTVPGDYQDIGRLELDFDADGEVVGFRGELNPVTGDIVADPTLVAEVEEPVRQYLEGLDQNVIATTEVPLDGLRADVRTRETNVGNLMVDSFLFQADQFSTANDQPAVHVALQNGGGIRNDSVIADGVLTELDTFDIAAFDNNLAITRGVSRDDLLAAVEHGLSGLPGQAGSFGQWGGLEIVYDPAAPSGDRVVSLTITETEQVVVDGGTVVPGDPIDIVSINFILGGNDGYDMFEAYDFTNIGVNYQQALAIYAEDLGVITAADYTDPVALDARQRIIPLIDGDDEMAAPLVPGPKNFVHVATVDVADVNGSGVAEIATVTPDGQTLYYTDAATGAVGVLDIADPDDPVGGGSIDVDGEPTSVIATDDLVLVAVNTSPDFVDQSGELVVLDRIDNQVIATHELAGQPDSIALSPDGSTVAIVIENERDEDLDDGFLPQLPSGALQYVTIAGDPATWTVETADLSPLIGAVQDGVDLEPEYVSINSLNRAAVTFQENNHIAIIDLATGAVVSDFNAGYVDLVAIDENEDDLISFSDATTRRREPDAITWIDDDHVATANEGDYESPNGEEGGSRGFTVFDVSGAVVFEAGGGFERLLASAGHYNESRSENKGAEPEAIAHGDFGGDDLTFVGSERANAVVVYDTADPAAPLARQTLPTGIGPEGLLPIPSRDLLVVSTETSTDDIPPVVSLYRYVEGPASYPMIVSETDAVTEDGIEIPIPWVALSGMVGDPTDPDTVYAVSDAFLAAGYIYTIDVSSTPAVITERMEVTGADDLDLEGIAIGPDGSFWLASEGDADGSTNRVLRVDESGAVTETIELPAALEAEARSNGFEGIAVTGDPGEETIYVAIQRAWPGAGDDDGAETRIGRYDVADEAWGFVHYEFEPEGLGDWIGLSELTLLPDGMFAVIERDKGWGESTGLIAETKELYRVDLATADFRADGEELASVDKELLLDLLPAMRDASVITPEKVEGLAVTADGAGFVVTDNDGLDDAPGETLFLEVGPLAGPFFADVDPDHPFFTEIEWMGRNGVSTGTVDPDGGLPLYQPTDEVLRQAMAAFLYRLAGSPAVEQSPHFADVDPDHPFFTEIQWMWESGASTGIVDPDGGLPSYKPDDIVRRQAMAAFLYRLAGSPEVTTTPFFADVDDDQQFFTEIQWMAEAGISTGRPSPGGGLPSYGPSDAVLRQAMAAFLYRIDVEAVDA